MTQLCHHIKRMYAYLHKSLRGDVTRSKSIVSVKQTAQQDQRAVRLVCETNFTIFTICWSFWVWLFFMLDWSVYVLLKYKNHSTSTDLALQSCPYCNCNDIITMYYFFTINSQKSLFPEIVGLRSETLLTTEKKFNCFVFSSFLCLLWDFPSPCWLCTSLCPWWGQTSPWGEIVLRKTWCFRHY